MTFYLVRKTAVEAAMRRGLPILFYLFRIQAKDYRDACGAACGVLSDELGEIGKRILIEKARRFGQAFALASWGLVLVERSQIAELAPTQN